ncbi:peptidase S8/S53 domain-containing protein [Daldinia grandis]|nr:peptidase S8/S53 domain-containing protein [Daldinia grandis]
MAKLICHACPFAQLYVAKLDGWKDPDLPHPQFTAKDAAEAVKWAIQENVDIISMSWNIERSRSTEADIDALASQIKIAANRNIIMYCAAQDKGQLGDSEVEVYPAGSDTTKLRIVGAADPTGHPLNIVSTSKVYYLFPGEATLENDNATITGSSAAAALAAGTAAMILFCYELGYGNMEIIAKPGRMGQLFNSLKKSTKYLRRCRVDPEAGADARTRC